METKPRLIIHALIITACGNNNFYVILWPVIMQLLCEDWRRVVGLTVGVGSFLESVKCCTQSQDNTSLRPHLVCMFPVEAEISYCYDVH